MRQTKTLLKIIQKMHKEKPNIGLCRLTSYSHIQQKLITYEEYSFVHTILCKNKPRKNKYYPWWFADDGIARGRFLEKLIIKYSKEKANGK